MSGAAADLPVAAPEFDSGFRSALRELFVWRRDVRRFRRTPLPAGALERLLELASLAPSVGLSQPWRFVVVEDAARRSAVRACFESCNGEALRAQGAQDADRASLYARLKLAGLDDAPCQIAVFADRSTPQGHGLGRRTMPEMIDYSTVIAIHTLWLAARTEGIGVGWVSILEPARIAAILETPEEWKLVGYLCVGYPAEDCDTPLLERQGWEQRRAASAAIIRR
ncbi:cob(II)yrinic acid a,c-diamide reductase [Rhizobiales bacterium GAS191]|nr:cob(II)yrinic acid a,c-diamide reductase [Rhizobiales bacterium GAS113]SEC46483.1 cob(II)yrinic acid a,c-diamide reductase [Rhizobiales bacterium GAS191]SEC79782.1 cob(II)yrinic acid a,c-diamide reductase [Rhizobiales bacterium GAS188]